MSGEHAVQGEKDWHSSKQIRKRARYLLEHPDEEIPSDVTFLVGDGQEEPQKIFKCHKFILAMVSAMFQAMFYGSFPQTDDVIKIPDVTPTAFQHMLRYAYGDSIDLGGVCVEDALDTLYCAKRYLLDKLARACRDHIQFQIVVVGNEPCVVLQRASQMGEDNLASVALRTIARSCRDVMDGDAFPRLSFDGVQRILDHPHRYAKETCIYQGVRRWVQLNVGMVTGSALRDALGSLLYSIRFPLFTTAELLDGPVQDDVLTIGFQPARPFLTTPRTPLTQCWMFCFQLVMEKENLVSVFEGFVDSTLMLIVQPDLAPGCCTYLRQLVQPDCCGLLRQSVANTRQILLASLVRGKFPLPTAVQTERNVLSHTVTGACWFEWDMKGGVPYNVRMGVYGKQHRYHSAVFGFVAGRGEGGTLLGFHAWLDQRIQGIDWSVAEPLFF